MDPRHRYGSPQRSVRPPSCSSPPCRCFSSRPDGFIACSITEAVPLSHDPLPLHPPRAWQREGGRRRPHHGHHHTPPGGKAEQTVETRHELIPIHASALPARIVSPVMVPKQEERVDDLSKSEEENIRDPGGKVHRSHPVRREGPRRTSKAVSGYPGCPSKFYQAPRAAVGGSTAHAGCRARPPVKPATFSFQEDRGIRSLHSQAGLQPPLSLIGNATVSGDPSSSHAGAGRRNPGHLSVMSFPVPAKSPSTSPPRDFTDWWRSFPST